MMYIGTYTGGESKGIYSFTLDPLTGKCSSGQAAARMEQASYLAAAAGGDLLFAVSELEEYEGKNGGAVASFRAGPAQGRLSLLSKAATYGKAPCHLCLDKGCRHLYTANYGEGSFNCFTIGKDGSIRPDCITVTHKQRNPGSKADAVRQEMPHVHYTQLSGDGRYLWVLDLGLDRIFLYPADPMRGLLSVEPEMVYMVPDGYGPRHLVFHPDKPAVYILQELSSRIVVLGLDKDGKPERTLSDISLLPENGMPGNTGAAIKLSPDGANLYATNRGHDSIAVFCIRGDGTLEPLEWVESGGKNPRDLALSPDGRYLYCANQDSGLVTVFEVDRSGGRLRRKSELDIRVPSPVCILFDLSQRC